MACGILNQDNFAWDHLNNPMPNNNNSLLVKFLMISKILSINNKACCLKSEFIRNLKNQSFNELPSLTVPRDWLNYLIT